MARYKLNRLEFLLRRLREEKVRFERRREREDKEIDRLGLAGYLKTDMALKSFGHPTAYELLAKIVDSAGYSRLLASGLSVKDIDVEELVNTGEVMVKSRADKRVPPTTEK